MLDFLNLKQEIFGMDISEKYIRIIRLAGKHKSFKLASFSEQKIKAGVIEAGVVKDEKALTEAIKAALNSIKGSKIKEKYVIVSLPEEKSFLQAIQMPKMTAEELALAIPFEAENYIPLAIDQVYLDYQKIDSLKPDSERLDVLIVAMPKNVVDSYVLSIKNAGLIPFALETEPQAMVRALIKNENSASPIVIINIKENKAVFVVFSGKSILFTCSFSTLLKKPVKAVTAKPQDVKQENSQAEDASLKNLASEIKKYLDFCQGHVSSDYLEQNCKSVKILLCGDATNYKNITDFLSKELGIPVEYGNPWINIFSTPPKKDIFNYKKDSLPFTTAIGLALRGFKEK